MVAVGELLLLFRVACAAILGRDNGGDQRAVVIEGVRVLGVGFVALYTADSLLRMGAAGPVIDDSLGDL